MVPLSQMSGEDPEKRRKKDSIFTKVVYSPDREEGAFELLFRSPDFVFSFADRKRNVSEAVNNGQLFSER